MKKKSSPKSMRHLWIWTDEGGKETPCAELKSSHIRNILRRIERYGFRHEWMEEYGDSWRCLLTAELKHRLTDGEKCKTRSYRK